MSLNFSVPIGTEFASGTTVWRGWFRIYPSKRWHVLVWAVDEKACNRLLCEEVKDLRGVDLYVGPADVNPNQMLAGIRR